jgi:tRNA-dihydrouridine synthase B
VDVPVTLKIRTGWDQQHRNAVRVASIAQSAGIRALAVHGRTRACGFAGEAEYATIAAVKSQVSIPVLANGDIDSPEKAKRVLDQTRADAIMVGRAAQGKPWIFREITHYLATGERLPPPLVSEVRQILVDHLQEVHAFYGDEAGVPIARKHIAWYTKKLAGSAAFRARVNRLETAPEQLAAVAGFFDQLAQRHERLTYAEEELAA